MRRYLGQPGMGFVVRRVAGAAGGGIGMILAVAAPGVPASSAPLPPLQATPVLRSASPVAPGQTVAPAQTLTVTATSTPLGATATATSTPGAATTQPPTAAATQTPAPTTSPPTPTSAAAGLANEERPIIIVEDYDVDPDRPAAGSSFTLRLRVANRGEHFAENISLALSGDAFLPTDQGANLFWNSLNEGDDDEREVRLRAASGLTAGVYRLGIALGWDDSYGGSYTDSTSIGIEVSSGATRPVVAVTGSRLPERVVPGTPFTLALDLVNSGGREARNIVAVPLAGPLALVGAGGSPPLGLAPGAAATLVLQLMASEPSQPGAATQTLELRYDSPDGERFTDSQALGVLVAGGTGSGPMPLIAAYETRASGQGAAGTVADLHPGQVFVLALDLVNVGARAAEGVRLVLGGTGAGAAADLRPFAPVGTSNVRYLDRLAAGERRTVTQQMVVEGGAEPGVYPLGVGFVFTDAKGEAHESSEVISLLVARRISLNLNPVEVVTSTVVGRPVRFSVELVNAGTGRVNVGNVEVVGSRYVAVTDGNRYVGALDAGSVDVIDATLEPKAPGSTAVTVVVHYLDDFAREQTLRQDFTLLVEESPAPEAAPDQEAPQGSLVIRILKGLLGLGASPPSPPSSSSSSTPASPGEASPSK